MFSIIKYNFEIRIWDIILIIKKDLIIIIRNKKLKYILITMWIIFKIKFLIRNIKSTFKINNIKLILIQYIILII